MWHPRYTQTQLEDPETTEFLKQELHDIVNNLKSCVDQIESVKDLHSSVDSRAYHTLSKMSELLFRFHNRSGAARLVYNVMANRYDWNDLQGGFDGKLRFHSVDKYTLTMRYSDIVFRRFPDSKPPDDTVWHWTVSLDDDHHHGRSPDLPTAVGIATKVAEELSALIS